MARYLFPLFFILLSCSGEKSSNPADYVDRQEAQKILLEIAHYAAKLPPGATHVTKFDAEFDHYYESVMLDFDLVMLHPTDDKGYDFLIARPARSSVPMFEGIGGKFIYEHDSLTYYNEVFRTWKMDRRDLDQRGKALFTKMVGGDDLSMYYSKYSGDKYIEYPDGRFTFDSKERIWKDNTLDSIH